MSFKVQSLALAVASLSAVSVVQAAGLDRSTQPSWSFTQDGTFAYVEHVTIDPSVEGKDTSGNAVPDMAEDYHFLNFGAKADLNDAVSLGVFFDQPWAADAQFSGNNNFIGTPTGVINGLYAQATSSLQATNPNAPAITNAAQLAGTIAAINNQIQVGQAQLAGAQTQLAQLQAITNPNPIQQAQIAGLTSAIAAGTSQLATAQAGLNGLNNVNAATTNLSQVTGGTNVSVSSQNFTGLLGVKFGDKKQFQIYGGPTLQRLEGNVHLRGAAYGAASGYDASISEDTAYGWMAGIAYNKPEIALKAALTYRSEIDHDTTVAEAMPIAPVLGLPSSQTSDLTITTPKSVNLDFQTGLNPTTLLTAKVRWVPWSDFIIKPSLYNQTAQRGGRGNLNLVDYDKDGWTAELGLGKKLSDKWAVSGSVGWDSGAGNPITSLGPVDGNWNVGLGAKYNITPEWAVSAGVKYLMFGDATAQLPDHQTNVGEFQDNDGMVYGLRLSYQKK